MTPWSKLHRLLIKMWLKVEGWCVLPIDPHLSGFHTLTQALEVLEMGVSYSKKKEYKEHIDALQQLFHISTNMDEDGVKTLTEKYLKFKKEYVKHLGFNPEDGSLSKYYKVFNFLCFQLLHWNMHHLRQSTSTLTRQPTMRLRGMRRLYSNSRNGATPIFRHNYATRP